MTALKTNKIQTTREIQLISLTGRKDVIHKLLLTDASILVSVDASKHI